MIVLDPLTRKGIVWLASYPKSGNTWLRAFLYGLYHTLVGDPPDEIDVNEMDTLLVNDRAWRNFEKYLGRPIQEAAIEEIAAVRPKVHADIMQAVNGPVLVKTHNAFIEDRGFPLVTPAVTAGSVYLVRNPLDVAISFARYRGEPTDVIIDDMANDAFGTNNDEKNVYYITTSWSEHVTSWTARNDPTVYVARYEDMLERPVETFSAIANHILMPHTPEQLQRAIDLAGFDRLRAAEAKVEFTERSPSGEAFFRAGRAGQWRDVLTEDQVNRIIDAHGEVMRRFGYLPQ